MKSEFPSDLLNRNKYYNRGPQSTNFLSISRQNDQTGRPFSDCGAARLAKRALLIVHSAGPLLILKKPDSGVNLWTDLPHYQKPTPIVGCS